MGLSDTQYELLKHMNKAKETNPNNDWVSIEDCNKNTLKSLERLMYIEVDEARISAVITKAGQSAYVDAKRERHGLRDVLKHSVNGNTELHITPEPQVPPSDPSPVKRGELYKSCLSCNGTGYANQMHGDMCPVCDGTGSHSTKQKDCAGDCDACLHREVLELIASKYPKVAELRDVLMQQKRLMKELGL